MKPIFLAFLLALPAAAQTLPTDGEWLHIIAIRTVTRATNEVVTPWDIPSHYWHVSDPAPLTRQRMREITETIEIKFAYEGEHFTRSKTNVIARERRSEILQPKHGDWRPAWKAAQEGRDAWMRAWLRAERDGCCRHGMTNAAASPADLCIPLEHFDTWDPRLNSRNRH